MKSGNLFWNENLVMAYLEEAAEIHRRLPAVRVRGFHTLWPTTMQEDDWQRLCGLLNGKNTLGSPMPPEVTYHEKVMEWLCIIDRNRQQVVWMRANRVPWKIIVDELERSKQTLWREMRSSLAEIAARLNVVDPRGQKFERLRLRANRYFSLSENIG